jgi:hypothetical protein
MLSLISLLGLLKRPVLPATNTAGALQQFQWWCPIYSLTCFVFCVFSLGSYLLLVVFDPVFLALSLLLDLRVLIILATLVTLDSVFF